MRWKREKEAVNRLRDGGFFPLDLSRRARMRGQFDEFLLSMRPFCGRYVRDGNLIYICLFRGEDQGPKYRHSYGVMFPFEDGAAAIALSLHTMRLGRETAAFTMLHEIAHLEQFIYIPGQDFKAPGGGHDAGFLIIQNRLLDKYRLMTGRNIGAAAALAYYQDYLAGYGE